ncbi:DsrE family protein [Arthrobacter sp. NPDC055138]
MTSSPARTPQGGAGRGLLIHSAGPHEQDALPGILRSAANARAALGPETEIEVLVQGPGVVMLATGTPASEAIDNARKLDVRILACGNSMRSAGLEDGDLALGVEAVPAAIAHLAQRQWTGWAYARL